MHSIYHVGKIIQKYLHYSSQCDHGIVNCSVEACSNIIYFIIYNDFTLFFSNIHTKNNLKNYLCLYDYKKKN